MAEENERREDEKVLKLVSDRLSIASNDAAP
jgi:hypothetical protein